MEYESDSTECVRLHLLTSKHSNHSDWLEKFIFNNIRSALPDVYIRNMQEEKKEESDHEQHVDKYNCRCNECGTKFGSLPLLVDVIEQNIQKTDNIEPQPSTSRQQSPPASSAATKSMKCKHCNKIFTHRGDLNKHLRKHTGEQPFKCKVCFKKFAHTSNLSRHLRLHSGDKPFTCDRCNKKFTRKDKLELHRKGKSCGRQ